MRTLLRTVTVGLMLVVCTGSKLLAQEPQKYDFAIIQYFCVFKSANMTICINGEKYEEVRDIESVNSKYAGWDLSAPLKKISEMQDQGWELFDQEGSGYGSAATTVQYAFYLRKKKSATTK